MNSTSRFDVAVLCVTGLLRSFAVGLIGVIFGVFLFRAGHSSAEIGILTAAGLAGATVATAFITWAGDRSSRKQILIVLALLSIAGGIGLAFVASFTGLLLLVFIGMVNAMGADRSASYVLEQAALPNLVSDRDRTWTFSWYHLVLDAGGAVGALAAGLPIALNRWYGLPILATYKSIFIGYSALGLAGAMAYSLLSDRIEAGVRHDARQSVSPTTKSRVFGLARLFAIDAFGGGLLTDAVVAYWFFLRFGVSEVGLGALFFTIHILNALSHLGAAWLAQRIGLLKTMVFTHLPSSIFLILVPIAPNFTLAAALLLARESLVEMDVPTRQSYVAAIVSSHERTFAAGVTNLTRNALWAAASAVAGLMMQGVNFSAPLFGGGSIKIAYDILLYRRFRHVKPPEEQ